MAQSRPSKLTVDQVLRLFQQLSLEEQAELRYKLTVSPTTDEIQATHRLAGEVESWLDTDLGGDLEAYSWAVGPVGSSVQYVHNVGFIVSEELGRTLD